MRCRCPSLLRAVVATLAAMLAAMPAARAGAAIVFVATLDGSAERPNPVASHGAGSATALLTGDTGAYVLSYSLNYAGLGSDAVDGHIHYAVNPPGRDPVDQTGPVVHGLDADFATLGADGSISGDWRFDDSHNPLTDALVDSLLDGELYFNIHSAYFGNGEIRGQLKPLGVGGANDPGNGAANGADPADGETSNGTAIPLPPALLLAPLGVAAAGWVGRRCRR